MKAHPIAEKFPMLGELDLQNLADDIALNGQKEAIVLYEGKILDGRNRYAACKLAKVEPRTKEFQGKNPVAFVLSKNVWRRHLTTRERAEIAVWASTAEGSNEPAMTQAKAAEALKISKSSVKRAKARIAPAPKKSKPNRRDESDGWTAAQLKEDEELSEAFDRIEKIYGTEDAKHIRNGVVPMNRKDVVTLSKLHADKMREIQDLIFANGWKPEACIKFLNRFKLSSGSTVEDLQNLCLGTKGKYWEGELSGFTYTCKATRAVKR